MSILVSSDNVARKYHLSLWQGLFRATPPSEKRKNVHNQRRFHACNKKDKNEGATLPMKDCRYLGSRRRFGAKIDLCGLFDGCDEERFHVYDKAVPHIAFGASVQGLLDHLKGVALPSHTHRTSGTRRDGAGRTAGYSPPYIPAVPASDRSSASHVPYCSRR
jgi:hypothetical protein